jgi:hypothetical protein
MTTFTVSRSVTAGLLGLGVLLATAPAQAASVDLSSWSIIGDGITSSSGATLTNQSVPGDLFSDGNTTINVSGQSPADIFGTPNFETLLGLSQGAFTNQLGLDVYEGSAIRKTLTVAAGEALSFNFSFPVKDAQDVGFVKIGSTLVALGGSPFSYTFATGGDYDIAIGVADVGDYTNSSKLAISGAAINAVPTPALLPGLIGFGVAALRKRRQDA